MIFSVIIPTYNSDKYLEECVIRIACQASEEVKIEIIAVDNGSNDNTIHILNKYHVKYVVDKNAKISGLRNAGFYMSRGEVIGFIDSDCFCDKNWLGGAIQIINEDKNVGIVGRYYGLSGNPTWVEKLWVDLKKDINGEVNFLPGGNMVMRREVFQKVGGFDENISTGEDYELCQRVRKMNLKVINSQNVNVSHMGNMKKLTDIVKKERWYGLGMLSTTKNGEISKPLIAAIIFTLLNIMILVTIWHTLYIAFIALFLQVIFVLIVSISFTKYIKSKRHTYIVKCIPIVCCYLLGRSLSLLDVINGVVVTSLRRK